MNRPRRRAMLTGRDAPAFRPIAKAKAIPSFNFFLFFGTFFFFLFFLFGFCFFLSCFLLYVFLNWSVQDLVFPYTNIMSFSFFFEFFGFVLRTRVDFVSLF